MPVKMTLSSWLERARAVHGDMYDYSHVVYTNRDTKVRIICPVHGEFEQRAGNHLKGKGCKHCAPNARGSQESFVQKARAVHGDLYDYEHAVFTKNAAKVIIGCPDHGRFEQEANSHLQGAGCPTCANDARSRAIHNHPTRVANIRETVERRYGVTNVMHVDAIKAKMSATMLERHGVENYRHADAYDMSYKSTVRERYGVDHYSQSDTFRQQVVDTCLTRYGVSNYTQSLEYAARLPEILQKSVLTQLERYGAQHYSQSEEARALLPRRLMQGYETKRMNNSFSTSKPERDMFTRLCDVFGADDVEQQYRDDRYPFQCDFYVKSRDLFIELNATWTHGGRWYDATREADIEQLAAWRAKESAYYDNAAATWTMRDVIKRDTAKANGLNYLVFWSSDLSDFDLWLTTGAPDGMDYAREYSWASGGLSDSLILKGVVQT